MKRTLAHFAYILPIGFCAFDYPSVAQSAPLVNVCSGLSVKLPTLAPIGGAADVLLGGLVTSINTNLQGALNGANIGVSVLDTSGNVLSVPGDCALSTDGVAVTANKGITIGGGTIDGLGGANASARAGAIDAVAVGNGATTDPAATGAVALGLRGSVTAVDGVALGRDATASAAGGIALGAGAVANRAGLNGATEALSGTAVASTAGAVSVGAAGAERQITNVAGGTQDTDAVNLRQLNSVNTSLTTDINNVNSSLTTQIGDVNTSLTNQISNVSTSLTNQVTTVNTKVDTGLTGVATALGGGANYDTTNSVFNGPSYQLRGIVYNDVGTALASLEGAIGGADTNGAVAATNTSGKADAAASGNDSTAVGYGARAAYNNSTALGNGVATTRANQVAIGTGSNTYTLAGVASNASRAAQVGPTQVLTSDAYGNLATADVDLGQMKSDISSLKKTTDDIRKEERRGIATAMAMAATPTPSAPGRTAWATNVASFSGQVAGSLAVAHRIDIDYPLILSAAVGYSPGAPAGVRVGLAGEF